VKSQRRSLKSGNGQRVRSFKLDNLESRLFLSASRPAVAAPGKLAAPPPIEVAQAPAGAAPLALIGDAPQVSQVYFASTGWSQSFKNQLAADGIGSAQYGYAIPGGNQQLTPLAWSGLNQISITFDQAVSVQQDDLHVHGVNVPDYTFSGFTYDPVSHTATWTLANGQSFDTDTLTLDVNGEGGTTTTIYDSQGFEHPRFVPGKLEGSDGANGPWVHTNNAGDAVVKKGIAAGGSQAVEVRRESSDERWAVRKTVAAPTAPVSVQWDVYVTQTSLPVGSFGPYYAVEAYDELGNAPRLAGSAGVDAATGEVLYQAAGTGFLTSTGQTVSFNAWHHFEMVLDYATDTYSVYVDNSPTPIASNIGFVDAGVNDFTDAAIAALAAGADPASRRASGLAYFDNYRVVNKATSAAYYDSGGFEFPRFPQDDLEGSDQPNGPWVYSGSAGFGIIEQGVAASGTQAVEIERKRADERWGVRKVVAAPTAPVSIQWDTYVTQTTLPLGSFGPYFAVEAYDELGNAPRLAGSAGVDAATGEVLYQAAGTGFLTSTGQTVSFNSWHHFEMILDYSTDTYSVYVDNVQVAANIGFVDAGVDDFTDAPIAALGAGADPASQAAAGLAYFDNYRIVQKPTPVNSGGIALDGEWFNGVSAYPSGDGRPGGAFLFTVNVLPGDFTGDGAVDFNDLVLLAQRFEQSSYLPYQGDATADGVTDFDDLVVLAQHYETELPSGYAASPVAAAPAAASAPFSTTRIKKETTPSRNSVLHAPAKAKASTPPAPAARPVKVLSARK
jgi:hypothetical protein